MVKLMRKHRKLDERTNGLCSKRWNSLKLKLLTVNMDGRTDSQTKNKYRKMDIRTDGWMEGCTSKRTDRPTDGGTGRQTDRQAGRREDG